MKVHDPSRQEDVYLEWRSQPCPECGQERPEIGPGGLDVAFTAAYGTTFAMILCLECGWWHEFDIYDDPAEEARVRY